MIECPTSELWAKLLEGDLSPVERTELERHLGTCDSCSILMALSPERHPPGSTTLSGNSGSEFVTSLTPSGSVATPSAPGPARLKDRRIVPPAIPGLDDMRFVKKGGMGVVFAAREVNLDRPVAVKVLSPGSRFAPSKRARAIRESLLMARLRHPNVVQIYRSGEVDGMPYLVLEWVEGGTLKGRIEEQLLAPRAAAETVRLLATAVAEAHALNIIHRDLKPENVMVAPASGKGLEFIPKLTDFGLARRVDTQGLTEPGIVCGTPGYMAPEQVRFASGAGKVGPGADIHGLGAILHACLTGKAPYDGESSWEKLTNTGQGARPTVRSLRPELPLDLTTIVEKCLQVEASRRYRSVGELADDLERFLEGRPILARPASTAERLVMWAKRRPTAAASAALLLLALMIGIAGMAYHVASIGKALRDLAGEQARTERALAATTEARNQARLALASLSGDVVERIMGRRDPLNEADRAFLRRIGDFYRQWPLDANPEAALKFRATGLGRLGDIFERIDQYDDSRICREAAIESYDECFRRGVASADVVDARIKTMVLLHQVHERSNQPFMAEAVARKLIVTHEPLARSSVNHRRNLGLDYVRLGHDLAKQQRGPEADAAFAGGMERLERLSREQPRDFEVRKAESRAYYIAAISTERPDRAEALHRRLIAAAGAALAVFPGNQEFLRYQALALAELVTITSKDRLDEALSLHRQRMDLARSLVDRDPSNNIFRGDLIHGAVQTYQLCRELGRPADAEPTLKWAIDEGGRMLDAEPAVFDRTRALVAVLEPYATLCEASGRPNRAVEQLDRLAAVSTPWTKLQGRSADVLPSLLEARRRSAAILSRLGDHAGAAHRLALATQVCQPEDRGRVHLERAAALLAAGDLPGARAAAEEARVGGNTPEAAQFLESLPSPAK